MDLQQEQKEWFEINAPLGKALGYPDCCIKAFCDQPPALLNSGKYKATKDDYRRYKAACINGKFTGLIPCAEHAKQIVMGKIMLGDLITNRDMSLPPFPFYAEQ